MLLIAENRKLDMMEALSYPLGPKPWTLANGDGSMKKTDKATLGRHLEKEAAYTDDSISGPRATIIDAMGIVQKISGENITVKGLSQLVLKQVVHNGQRSERIDVVFDLYGESSVEDAERVNRGSREGVIFKQINSTH